MSPADVSRIDWDGTHVPPERWGRDHWTVFAYLGHCVHKSDGVPDRDKMRCKPGNPLIGFRVVRIQGDREYPTKLIDGLLYGHDDYDCADDFIAAGLMTSLGTGAFPRYNLTPAGVFAWSHICFGAPRNKSKITWDEVLVAVRANARLLQAFLQGGGA
jgi:hypothetical protein